MEVNVLFSVILEPTSMRNFFSIIRSHVRYPNLWEYGCTYSRANLELVKRFAVDRPFPLMNKLLSKRQYYNNQSGLKFHMEDVSLTSYKIKSSQNKENKGTHNQESKCQQLANQYPCTRKRLLIREKTCKEDPTQVKSQRGYLLCPFSDCVKTLKYPKAMGSHMQTAHGYSKQKADSYIISQEQQGLSSLDSEPLEYMDIVSSIVIDEMQQSFLSLGDKDFTMEKVINTSNSQESIILWDIETTAQPDFPAIIEIACWNICSGDTFRRIINPQQTIHHIGTSIHGYTDIMIQNYPIWPVIYEELLHWTEQCTTIYWFSHGSYDATTLKKKENIRATLQTPENWHFVSSEKFFKHFIGGEQWSIDFICGHFGIQRTNAHHAVGDVQILWMLIKTCVQSTVSLDPFIVLFNYLVKQELPSIKTSATHPLIMKKKYICGKCGKLKKGHVCTSK